DKSEEGEPESNAGPADGEPTDFSRSRRGADSDHDHRGQCAKHDTGEAVEGRRDDPSKEIEEQAEYEADCGADAGAIDRPGRDGGGNVSAEGRSVYRRLRSTDVVELFVHVCSPENRRFSDSL